VFICSSDGRIFELSRGSEEESEFEDEDMIAQIGRFFNMLKSIVRRLLLEGWKIEDDKFTPPKNSR